MTIGRFQVMAILQAARAYVLGLPLTSAKSFGLNRAIFYAAAKKGFTGSGKRPPESISLPGKKLLDSQIKKIVRTIKPYYLGDEMAYSIKFSGKLLFLMGPTVQTIEAFKRQIEERFGKKFKKAWVEAIKTCKQIDEKVLKSQLYFYSNVYKPQRDELAKKWSK